MLVNEWIDRYMLRFLDLTDSSSTQSQGHECSSERQSLLRSGVPCVKHTCVRCCVETEMPLSSFDIKKILRLGYGLNEFTVKVADGWRLKNISGRCVFLAEGGCTIYLHRPQGCRLYPLIYDEALKNAVIDPLCPYGGEFTVKKEDLKKLENLLGRL